MKNLGEIIKNDALKKIEQHLPTIVEHAKKISIQTEGDLAPVAEFKTQIKKRIGVVLEKTAETISKAHGTWKSALAFRNKMIEPLKQALDIIAGKNNEWQIKQEKIREEARNRAISKAQKEEGKRKADLKRQADRWLAKQKELEKKARETQNEAEKLRLEKQALTAKLKIEEKQDMQNEVFVAVEEPKQPPKTIKTDSGAKITSVKDVKVEVTDIKKVLQAVLDKRLPESIIEIKLGTLKTFCKAMDISGTNMPGIRVSPFYRTR